MGIINIAGISPYRETYEQPEEFNLNEALQNVGRGFGDENLLAILARDKISYGARGNPYLEKDPNYNVYLDPQFRGLEEYMGNFLHANNKQHASALIKDFLDGADKYKSSPSYIVGRILGGLTDPTSLFFFSKASNVLMRGTRLSNSLGMGSLVAGEELVKAQVDPNRPISDTALITAGGFILPALFPAIPKGSAKNFDRAANFYDKVDEYYRAGGSVGAKSFWKADLAREADDLNKIAPTGMGIFGENSRTTPVFRTLQEKIDTAQDFIESTLEIPLMQKKNFLDEATKPSIERNIKSRYYNVIQANEEMMGLYDEYLHYKGLSGRAWYEKIMDRKFTLRNDVINATQFRELVFEKLLMGKNYKIANQDDRINDIIKQAAETQRKYYDDLVNEYDNAKIVQSYLDTNIERLDFFREVWKRELKNTGDEIRRGTLSAKIADISVQINKLQKRLDYVNKNGIRRRDYVNIVYKRDVIDARFSDFQRIMREILNNPNDPKLASLTKDEIESIIENFRNYQPVIQFSSVWDVIGKQIPKLETVDKVSSRFYSRHIDLGKFGYKKLMDAGFIEKDLTYLNRLYFNQVVPDIEVSKVFGDPLGLGSRTMKDPDSPFQRGLLAIDMEYNRILEKTIIEKGFDSKAADKVRKARKEALEDAYAGIQLVQGTRGLHPDPNRWQSRMIRMVKLYNAMTMLTGLSQVVDVARLVTTNGIMKTMGVSWDVLTSGMAKELYKMNKKSINLGGEALDLATSSTVMRMYDIDDAYGVFNKTERTVSSLGNIYFTFFNLSNPWNTFVKTLSSTYNSTRMLETIEGWVEKGTISKVNKARLQSLGIDLEGSKKILTQYKKYGVGKGSVNDLKAGKTNLDYKYMRTANTDAWDDPDAAKLMNDALAKQGNIDIVTPGKGDVPLWTNSEMGGLLTQFKKWAFSSTQRIGMRGLQERDMNQLVGVMLLMMGGAAVDAIRTNQGGRDYSKKKGNEKLVDAFDRSGLGGIFSDINNNLERLTNNQIGMRPLLGDKKPYGTYRDVFNNPIPDVLGPTANQIANISEIMWAWGTGTYNHHDAKNVRRLIPFQNVWWLDSNFDKIEKGLR